MEPELLTIKDSYSMKKFNSSILHADFLYNLSNAIGGYRADRDTGTPEYNQILSQRRGEAVFDLLVGKFGINPSQLEIRAVGSSEQMFEGAACNRVVVIEN